MRDYVTIEPSDMKSHDCEGLPRKAESAIADGCEPWTEDQKQTFVDELVGVFNDALDASIKKSELISKLSITSESELESANPKRAVPKIKDQDALERILAGATKIVLVYSDEDCDGLFGE